jgi:ClpP class serine protease
MSHPRIASRLYLEPWACLPEVHAGICAQFRGHLSGAPRMAGDDPVGPAWVNPWTGKKEYDHPQVLVEAGIALMRVHGIIGKHLSGMEMQCGGYDIGLMGQQLANIADDPKITHLVIDFDTPGGVALGVETAAHAIRQVSESGKKVIGYTDYQCASAGYWLAAACDEFHAEASAIVGSISTFCAGIDSHRMWEMAGLELKLFRTGEIKAIGHPGKAWTEEEEEFMAEKTRAIDADFKGFVGGRRGLAAEQMNGSYWYAKHAPAGLVDGTEFPSLTHLLQSVALESR